jgi:hypothetical protein
MSLKELFADRDVLDGDQPLARFVLGDRVHQQRRVAVAETIEKDRDVNHWRGGHWLMAAAGRRAGLM